MESIKEDPENNNISRLTGENLLMLARNGRQGICRRGIRPSRWMRQISALVALFLKCLFSVARFADAQFAILCVVFAASANFAFLLSLFLWHVIIL